MSYKVSKIPELMGQLTWEQLSNSDGSFNRECVPFEVFQKEWLKDSEYEYETEWAQKRLYELTLKRIHTCYRAEKEKHSH